MKDPSLEDMKTITYEDLTDAEEEAISARTLAQMMAENAEQERVIPAEGAPEKTSEASEETSKQAQEESSGETSGQQEEKDET